MGDNDNVVGVVVEARVRAQQEIGAFAREIRKLDEEVARLKKTAGSSVDAENKLGAAMLRRSEMAQRLKEAIKSANVEQSAFAVGIQEATAALAPHAGALGGLANALAAVASPAGLAVAGLAAVALAIDQGARGLADYQERLDIASDSLGFSTAKIAAFKVSATESGRSFEQIRPQLDFFVRKVGEAGDNVGKSRKQFKDLGVDVLDAAGNIRSSGELFEDVREKLANITNESERARIASDFFGRGVSRNISIILKPLDEAEQRVRKLGLALGPEGEAMARRADAAYDQLDTSLEGLKVSFGLVAATIASPFIEQMNSATIKLAEFAAKSSKEFARIANDPNAKKAAIIMLALTGNKDAVEALFFGSGPIADGVKPKTILPKGTPATPAGGEKVSQSELPIPKAPEVDKDIEALVARIREISASVAVGAITGDQAIDALNNLRNQVSVQAILADNEEKRKALVEVRKKSEAEVLNILERQNRVLRERGDMGDRIGPTVPEGFKFYQRPTIESMGFKRTSGPDAKRMDFDVFRRIAAGSTATGKGPKAPEMKDELSGFQTFVNASIGALKTSFGTFIKDAIMGVGDLDDLFKTFISDTIDKILGKVVDTGINALFKGLSFGVLSGGGWYRASGGMSFNSPGHVGIDSKPVLMQRNESIFDSSLTLDMRQFIRESRSARITDGAASSLAPVIFGPGSITISSVSGSPKVIRRLMDEELIPAMQRAVQAGRYRRRLT